MQGSMPSRAYVDRSDWHRSKPDGWRFRFAARGLCGRGWQRQVMVPALDMFLEMDQQFIDLEQLREILADEMFEGLRRRREDILNARVKDILAASRMAARQRMAQSLPMLRPPCLPTDAPDADAARQESRYQRTGQHVVGYCGLRNKADLIADTAAEDQQRAAAQNPGVQKMAADKQHMQMATDGKLQSIDAEQAPDMHTVKCKERVIAT